MVTQTSAVGSFLEGLDEVAGLLGAMLIVGCGATARPGPASLPPSPSGSALSPSKTAPSPSSTTSAASSPLPLSSSKTRIVSKGKLSVRVPASWIQEKNVIIGETAANGSTPGLLLPVTSSEVRSNVPGPNDQSPFFLEQRSVAGTTDYLNLYELAVSGNYYNLQLSASSAQSKQFREALASIKVPPAATATDVVGFIKKYVRRPLETRVGRCRWAVIGGNVGTEQEDFALFRSTDAGKTWSVERHTTGNAAHDFMGLEGSPTIFFWSSMHGFIAESSGYFVDHLLIYRTTDGGQHWTTIKVPTQGQPNGTTPVLKRGPSGVFHLTARLQGGKTFRASSTDGGKTWTP